MSANSTKGTLLQVKIAGVFTTIRQRISIKPRERTRNEIDTTDLDSLDDTSLPGIRRGGELEFAVNLDLSLAEHAYIEDSMTNGRIEEFKVILADAGLASDAFTAWVKSAKWGDAEVDKKQEGNYKLKITGASTITP